MSEFSIIDRYCHGVGKAQPETSIGVGDDAAVMTVPAGMQLAVSMDTMVEGVHFFEGTDPADIAAKLIAVNVSDMAAMGAAPKWATLALTIPQHEEPWLAEFSQSLDSAARRFDIELVGGDTTCGPLTLSVNIMGLLPIGKALTRHGAKPGDEVYVSNTLGDAALGLAVASGETDIDPRYRDVVLSALNRPEPQLALGQGLLELASACLDVSDGLVGDLQHIAQQSDVSIEVDVALLPLSDAYHDFIKRGGDLVKALSGGDDYQLAFCCPSDKHLTLAQLADDLSIQLTKIGRVRRSKKPRVSLIRNGKPFKLNDAAGFQHF